MSIEKILVIDDDEIVRSFITETLKRNDFDVCSVESGDIAVKMIEKINFDLIFTDMKMPGASGLDVLKKVKEICPSTQVVVITGHGTIENAVEAMRFGAFNYIIKPFSPDTIEMVINKAQEHQKLLHENSYWKEEVAKCTGLSSEIIAESASMRQVLDDIQRVAKSNSNIFITGESGTGKEVISQAIHYQSLRCNMPFIRVNCAAIPDTLIESEFFGHEKGSFTGANNKRLGRFELANGGTLLLDEVTEIPIALQAKLLRVIQEQHFERVGGSKSVKVDVRLIATSNRDMRQAIADKVLREDLYYRLNVIPIHLPPLRDRKEDIIALADYFLKKVAMENHKDLPILSQEAIDKLMIYSWPGNVRELANVIERAAIMSPGLKIQAEQVYIDNVKGSIGLRKEDGSLTPMSLRELEKRLILETLQEQNNNQKKAAEILQISTRTLRNKLNQYNQS